MADDIRPMFDMSCYITIENKLDVPLILHDYHGNKGSTWEVPPPNKVEAGQGSGEIHLKDGFAQPGAEGFIVYKFLIPGLPDMINFRMEFDCPNGVGTDNKFTSTLFANFPIFKAETNWNKNGHPLRANLRLSRVSTASAPTISDVITLPTAPVEDSREDIVGALPQQDKS